MAEGRSFWSSLQGIPTALAGLITAGEREAGVVIQTQAQPALLERLGCPGRRG